MRIATLCPVHRRPDLVLEQIRNYLIFGGPEFFHILHPSQEGRSQFSNIRDQLLGVVDIHLCDESWKTSWSCGMAAYLSCTKKLESLGEFDYVYLHTDADLLIKKGLLRWIKSHEIGFNASKHHDISSWFHFDSLKADSVYLDLRRYLGIKDDEILYGRQEGVFFKKELWFEIVVILRKFFSCEYFSNATLLWPLEESVIPTVAKFITQGYPSSSNVIYTKKCQFSDGRDNDKNCLNLDDIKSIRLNSDQSFFGAKWFSQNTDDSARKFLDSLLIT